MSSQSKQHWIDVIANEQMPIFGITAGKLASMSVKSSASSAEVAQVVLGDPTMTTRVLQIANTVYYNPTSVKINTVSRAVVILGFDKIHAICVSVSIVDSLLKGNKRDILIEEVSKSIHAAVQAKSFVQLMNNGAAEEVFIAALLYHLGELAFWCFGDEKADELLTEMSQTVDQPPDLQKAILGFTLKELTQDLSKTWNLGETLDQALENSANSAPWIQSISIAHDLVKKIDCGWDSMELKEVLSKISELVQMAPHQVKTIVQRNAEEALRQADMFRIPNAKEYIQTLDPVPDIGHLDFDGEEEDEIAYPEPDEHIQLDILRDLSDLMNNMPDINIILNLVLEGLHRGVGLDRVTVAFPSKEKKFLAAKFILEYIKTDLKESFHFKVGTDESQLFFDVMSSQSGAWIGNNGFKRFNNLLSNDLTRKLQCNTFFVSPVIYKGRSIGIFYADRMLSKRELDENAFRGFQHFVREANKAIDSV